MKLYYTSELNLSDWKSREYILLCVHLQMHACMYFWRVGREVCLLREYICKEVAVWRGKEGTGGQRHKGKWRKRVTVRKQLYKNRGGKRGGKKRMGVGEESWIKVHSHLLTGVVLASSKPVTTCSELSTVTYVYRWSQLPMYIGCHGAVPHNECNRTLLG